MANDESDAEFERRYPTPPPGGPGPAPGKLKS